MGPWRLMCGPMEVGVWVHGGWCVGPWRLVCGSMEVGVWVHGGGVWVYGG